MRNIFAACLRWWGALSKFAHGKQINKNKNNTESNLLPNLRPSQMISAQLSLSSILNLRRRKRQMLRVLKEYSLLDASLHGSSNWLNYFMACAPIPSTDWRKWLGPPTPLCRAILPVSVTLTMTTTSATADCHKALDSHFLCMLYIVVYILCCFNDSLLLVCQHTPQL